jgi:hypothetical protein
VNVSGGGASLVTLSRDQNYAGRDGANYAAVLVVLQIAVELSHCTTNVQNFFQFNAT